MRELPSIALSIRQPWAWMIIHGGKNVENRSWSTRFRGPVLIHAAKGMTVDEYLEAREFANNIWSVSGKPEAAKGITGNNLERGGIIGVAEIVGCVTESKSPWFVGDYGFTIANPRPLPFHPCKGSLGFFTCFYPAPQPAREASTTEGGR